MFQLNVPALTSYPVAAAAVVICAAVLSLNVARTPDAGSSATVAMHQQASDAVAVSDEDSDWNLSTPVATRSFASKPFRFPSPQTHGRAAMPRYVLDSTPVSYEASLRF